MSDSKKMLTISIAAYNVEFFIEKTISSCLSETTKNLIEILVIVDGSTDRTAIIAEEYEKQYPDTVHVIKKENGGYGSTINTSISLANGKYFKLLDGDDWFDLDGLNSLLLDLQTSEADMYITPYVKYSERDGKAKICDTLPEVESGLYSINDNIDFAKALAMHAITYRTEILCKMGKKITEHCYYTDNEFIIYPFPGVNTIFVSHIPVYWYRIGRDDQSMSVLGIQKHNDEHELIISKLLDFYHDIEDKHHKSAEILYDLLLRLYISHYINLCMFDVSLKNFKRIKGFDEKLKNESVLYEDIGKKSRTVKHLRRANFLTYILICFVIFRKKKYARW